MTDAQPPPSEPRLPEATAAVFEAALGLPQDQLSLVVHGLMSAVANREIHEEQARLEARHEALTQLAELSAVVNEARSRIDVEVVKAKTNGASWADIGTATGVRREAAYKRWSDLVAEAMGDAETPEPTDAPPTE